MGQQWHRIEYARAPAGHALTAKVGGTKWTTYERPDGQWQLEGGKRTHVVPSLATARQIAEGKSPNPTPGHYARSNDRYYADTAFLNAINSLPSRSWSVRHLGMGEFVIDGPGGSIEVDRMRGRDFPGQSGRSHELYDTRGGTRLVETLIAEMEAAGLVEEATEVTAANPEFEYQTPAQAKRRIARGNKDAAWAWLDQVGSWPSDDREIREVTQMANRLLGLRGNPRRNPIKGMPGGSVKGCIQKMRRRGDIDDPGAYCAAIADRIEPGWRSSNPAPKHLAPGQTSWIPAEDLQPGMTVLTPLRYFDQEEGRMVPFGRIWPDAPDMLVVEVWDLEEGESLLVDPDSGQSVDLNTADYPSLFGVVALRGGYRSPRRRSRPQANPNTDARTLRLAAKLSRGG